MSSILAIDPGKTCGTVLLDDDGHLVVRSEESAIGAIQAVDDIDPDTRVAVEAFHVAPRYASAVSNKTAIEVIGAIKYLCAKRGLQLCLVSPGTHKPFPKQYPPGLSQHEKDAYSVGTWALKFGKFRTVTEF